LILPEAVRVIFLLKDYPERITSLPQKTWERITSMTALISSCILHLTCHVVMMEK